MTTASRRAISQTAEEALASALGAWRVEHHVPGATLVIADGDGRSTSIVDGAADVEHDLLVTGGHRFEIGSISKSFTAVVVLRLAARGAIDLDSPVRRYLPWFRAGSVEHRITIHQLLCHASGLPNGADFSDRSAFDAWILREQDIEAPGRYWYSNAGYKLLGLVIERVTGRSYGEVLSDEVLVPLEMRETSATVRFADRARLATGYEPEPGTYPVPAAPVVPAPFIEVDTADGSAAATAGDMGRYLSALLDGGATRQRLLAPDAFERLLSPHVRTGGTRGYGYGLWVDAAGGRRMFGHGGDMLGFRSSMVCDRDAGLGVVLLANQRRAPTALMARHALNVAIAERRGAPLPGLPPTTRADLRPWLGTYGGPSGTLTVVLADGQPRVRLDGVSFELIPGEEGRVDIADGRAGRYPLWFRRSRHGRLAVHGARVYGDPPEAAGDHARPSTERRRRRLTGRFEAHNPWRRSFDVVARGRRLILIEAEGEEEPLRPLARDRFRVGSPPSPERLTFDAVVDGQALRATASGHPYYRTRE